MLDTLKKAPTEELVAGDPKDHYEKDERVIFTALVNSPGHYKDGDKVSGTVIHSFRNGDAWTHRVCLDMEWSERVIGKPRGEKIIVGNIRASSLRPLLE